MKPSYYKANAVPDAVKQHVYKMALILKSTISSYFNTFVQFQKCIGVKYFMAKPCGTTQQGWSKTNTHYRDNTLCVSAIKAAPFTIILH